MPDTLRCGCCIITLVHGDQTASETKYAAFHNAFFDVDQTDPGAHLRERWFALFRDLKLNFTPSSGNFVFFETGLPHATFAAALLKEGVAIGRAFPPYDRWARISIGLPEENAIARAAVGKKLSKLPS